MTKPLISKKRAKALSAALFLVGMAIIMFLDSWWPGIMLVIGIPLAMKQIFNGRIHDAAISIFVFVGFFVIANFNISWKVLIPILFIMAAIYIVSKEWMTTTSDEEEEEGTITILDEDDE